VIVKPTTFQNDSVAFTGWQLGGTSVIPDKDFQQARFADDVVSAAGAGEFDATTLRRRSPARSSAPMSGSSTLLDCVRQYAPRRSRNRASAPLPSVDVSTT
jgi:hypothetical protein